ncbi:hypothetical protein CXZ10_11230 [Pleomorphomonas diazotrophica]|uniref:Uncharacterized protein n=1 Tax=Pleomorphomonas diazotrophica TaxID=1166257 RepID=A0A1I4WJK5_9HYPH|nr:hypothetical protein [Pleomorphomonas diazotrophica]PKR89082.1 hypothetical protein CXZ10_11230 [Pleomorphomonas diazotrophica]SFN13416.1 hypothetical protein SAMN05192571_11755 [Pleomorphomonas diazotrophica]
MNKIVDNSTLTAAPVSLGALQGVGVPQDQAEDGGAVFKSVAPHASNADDAKGLNGEARVALSGWLAEQCQRSGSAYKRTRLHGDALQRQTIALLSLEVALFPEIDWDERLDALHIDRAHITSKHKMCKAVAATFGLDSKADNLVEARQAGKMIDRLALTVEWLANQIRSMTPAQLKAVTFDDQGVKQLVALLMSVGGITKASDLQRGINNGRGKVIIDRFAGAVKRADKGKAVLRKRDGLAEGADIPISITVTVGNKQVPFEVPQSLVESIKGQIYEDAYEVSPIANMLGELVEVGSVVAHREQTLAAGSLGADPEMYAGSRQFVLRPDQSILISSITPTDSCGPVVVARPKVAIVDPWPAGFCRLSSEGWSFAEANLLDADRRKYFDASIMASANTACAASIELITSVAGIEKARSYSVDVLPIASGLASYPLEFTLDKFSPEFEFAVSREDLKAWGALLPSRVSNRHKIELMSVGGGLSLLLGSHDFYPSHVTKVTDDEEVLFAPGILLSVLRMLVLLPLTDSDVEFEADPVGGMHIRFATEAADYELYIPAIMERGPKAHSRDLRPIPVA